MYNYEMVHASQYGQGLVVAFAGAAPLTTLDTCVFTPFRAFCHSKSATTDPSLEHGVCPNVRRAKLSASEPGTDAKSFPPTHEQKLVPIDQYRPAPFKPFLWSNPHFQTIIPNFYPVTRFPQYTRITIESDDGLASFHVDIANGNSLSPADAETAPTKPLHYGNPPFLENLPSYAHKSTSLKPSKPVVVVLTGLESCSRAIIPIRIVNALTLYSFKVFVLNYRSCGGPEDVPTTFRLYHAAFTEDLQTLLRAIANSAIETGYIPPQVFVCGFSLGANIICHFLGRNGDRAYSAYNVVAAACACVPFDPTSCQKELDSGWKGFIYSSYLIQTMRSKFFQILNTGADPGDIDPDEVRRADRLGKIDDCIISPNFGFRDRFDYYQHVDARFVLKFIKVPTLIINARDDPFFGHMSGKSLPTQEQIGSAPIHMYITDFGGHCGFFDYQAFRDRSMGYFQREFAKWFSFVRSSLEDFEFCGEQ